MIGVIVREQHRVHTINPGGNELEPELRRSVNEQPGSVIRLHHCPHAIALVARIGRAAHFAVAANLRNPKTRAGTEKEKFQRVSTLRRFVVPGTSNGTPAVTITRSPAEASCFLTTVSRAITIISS